MNENMYKARYSCSIRMKEISGFPAFRENYLIATNRPEDSPANENHYIGGINCSTYELYSDQ